MAGAVIRNRLVQFALLHQREALFEEAVLLKITKLVRVIPASRFRKDVRVLPVNAARVRRLLPIGTAVLLVSGVLAAGAAGTAAAGAESPVPVAITLGGNQISSATVTAGSWCLDNSGGSDTAGNPIDIFPCNDTWDGQLWTVEYDGTVRIQNRCLDAPGTANGTQLVLDPCNGAATPGEQWQPMSDGSIENVASGRCMGITGGDPVANGDRIIIWTCDGADTQQWHLPAATTRAAIAAARLQLMYNGSGTNPTDLFENPCGSNCWWWSANELNALIDYGRMAKQASDQPNSQFPGWSRYQTDAHDTFYHYYSSTNDDFIHHTTFFDDMGWWGLTWLNAYGEYGDANYLTAAEDIATYIDVNAWTTECGGGAWQTEALKLKDAIVNELFFELSARLYRTTGDVTYLTWANDAWNWIKTHLIVEVPESSSPTVATPADLANPNAHLLVADHVNNDPGNTDDCMPSTGQKWSYNQGVLLGALHDMYKITGDASYLTPAEAIANTVENDVQVNINQPAGTYSTPALVDKAHNQSLYSTLSEPCEALLGKMDWPDGCDVTGAPVNGKTVNNAFLQFKGIFMRNLACLSQDAAGSPSYNSFITNNAWEVFNQDQNTTSDFTAHADLNLFGFLWDNNGNSWPGTETNELNEATQGSALDALVANMAGTPTWC